MSSSAPFYCYTCRKYLNPEHVLPQNYLCRFCNTGFIEEIHPGINNLTDDDPPNSSNPSGTGVNLGELLGMMLGGQNTNTHVGGNDNGTAPDRTADNTPRQRTAGEFIQSTLMPAFLQAMSGGGQNTNTPSTNRRSNSSGPARTGGDQPEEQQDEGIGFLQALLNNLVPSNTVIRIQAGGGGGGGTINFGNINLGDFATDANFDEIVTNILNTFDSSANTHRISDEDLQHLPRSKVTQNHVDNEAQCTTCMDQFNLNEEVGELACHHIFHPDCIIPWLRNHNTCPICRHEIDPEAERWRNENPSNPIPAEQRNGFRDGDELD